MTSDRRERDAFVLRIHTGTGDRVPQALDSNQIMIGWAYASGLLESNLEWLPFRDIVHRTYYIDKDNYRKSGNAGGHLWRFIRDMKKGDLVIVPHGPEFYVAQILGPAIYDESKIEDDTAYRRDVEWLKEKKAIPRRIAKAALQSRMKTQGTCAYATDVLDEIEDCLEVVHRGEGPSFDIDLHQRLIGEAIQEIRSGRLDSYGFENILASILRGLGAKHVNIIRPRSQDKGADILATFLVAGAIKLRVAVQAKHYQPEPPVGPDDVEELVRGVQAEGAHFGLLVTSGTISEQALEYASKVREEHGISIEFIDGDNLASIIIEHGLSTRLTSG